RRLSETRGGRDLRFATGAAPRGPLTPRSRSRDMALAIHSVVVQTSKAGRGFSPERPVVAGLHGAVGRVTTHVPADWPRGRLDHAEKRDRRSHPEIRRAVSHNERQGLPAEGRRPWRYPWPEDEEGRGGRSPAARDPVAR